MLNTRLCDSNRLFRENHLNLDQTCLLEYSTLQKSIFMPVLCIYAWCTLEISDCTYTTHFLFDAGECTGNPVAWTRLIQKRCGEETKRDVCICDSTVAAVNVPIMRHHLMICWSGRLYSYTHLVIFLQMFLVVSDSCSQNSNWVETKTEGLSDHTVTVL